MKISPMNEILKRTLWSMPYRFSSNEFASKAIRLGFMQKLVDRGWIAEFLRTNAKRGKTLRTWHRTDIPIRHYKRRENKIAQATIQWP